MPVIHADQAAVHQMHGTSFTAYASPGRGSRELCAWHIEIPGHTEGVRHHVSREEVLYLLSGTIRVSLDEQAEEAAAGDVILVPAGARFGVDNLSDGRPPRGSPPASACSACCRTARGSARRGPSEALLPLRLRGALPADFPRRPVARSSLPCSSVQSAARPLRRGVS